MGFVTRANLTTQESFKYTISEFAYQVEVHDSQGSFTVINHQYGAKREVECEVNGVVQAQIPLGGSTNIHPFVNVGQTVMFYGYTDAQHCE